jgi:hypothetical protein
MATLKKLVLAKNFREARYYIDKSGLKYPTEINYISDPLDLKGLDRNILIILYGNYLDNPNINYILATIRSRQFPTEYA